VTWSIADGWTPLGEASNGIYTYYRTANYAYAETDTKYNVLDGDKVTYNENLTKEMINDLVDGNLQPKLSFKAFAVQQEAATDAAGAWEKVPAADKLV